MARKTLRTLVAALGAILLPLPAAATFHLMKIVEVFPGTSAAPTAQYIMLQMYFPGQNLVAGHSVEVFDAGGTSLGTFTFASKVANGGNLATILIATPDAATLFGLTADLVMTPVIAAGGGAVCYDVIDCVTWGSFSAAAALPVPPGTPFNAPTGLVLDMAMHRNLSSGGAVTTFAFAPPAPKNNAGTSGMLGATPTPTNTPTPVVTPSPPSCVGDCDGSGDVTVDELLLMVNVALETADVATCPAGDADHDGAIVINEILAAVVNALNACPAPRAAGLPQLGWHRDNQFMLYWSTSVPRLVHDWQLRVLAAE